MAQTMQKYQLVKHSFTKKPFSQNPLNCSIIRCPTSTGADKGNYQSSKIGKAFPFTQLSSQSLRSNNYLFNPFWQSLHSSNHSLNPFFSPNQQADCLDTKSIKESILLDWL